VTPLGGLEASAFGQAVRDWFPLVKGVHLAGIALLIGTIAVVDLRLLGLLRDRSVRNLAKRLLPWTAGSFLLIVPSGLLMFIAHASEFIDSEVFVIKMLLIMAAGVNAGLFHTITFRTADVWDSEEMRKLPPPPSARLAGGVSLLIWISVIACGRLLAYF
jgi:uncharacterized membrane-anchored protein